MAALMSLTDRFHDVTPYRLPRAMKRCSNKPHPYKMATATVAGRLMCVQTWTSAW